MSTLTRSALSFVRDTSIAGVGMVALPAGILASGFSLELPRRREAHRRQVHEAFAEGGVCRAVTERLDQKRGELGLSEEEAQLVHRAQESNKPLRR